MVDYDLFQSRDLVTPFVTVAENTIDTSSTSINLVGKRKEAYGQPEQQSKLNMLEHFAHSTKPSNAILGQAWYNTVDSKLYVCINEGTQAFEKISNPLVSSSTPTLSLTTGDLWYNDSGNQLYVYNGASFDLIGPLTTVPTTVASESYITRTTADASASKLWVDGVTNSRLVLPNNESWLFTINLIARRTDTPNEIRSWIFNGTIDNTSNTVALIGTVNIVDVAIATNTETWAVAVTADNTNKNLDVEVTGQTGKTIIWNGVAKLTKVS